MTSAALISTIILAPLLGFIINGLRYKKHSANVAGAIASIAVGISFVFSLISFFNLISLPEASRKISANLFPWIQLAGLDIQVGFNIDQISGIMILIITGVGFLIHLFSVGYMHHDKGAAKYFAYLNLFIFNMLLLVLGDNLLVMFVGWEGVGLCSYLLIGFWFSDEAKAAAGMKAFITNRIGDAGFLLGMFIIFVTFGTLSFSEINLLSVNSMELSWGAPLTLATLFLFIGATGKSAQIPLYVWLPDAMAGPTPVSALIHAATMVTAGVYMIIRLSSLFIATPLTMHVIAVIGAITALVAATIGITQWDIKKILAYSTVSQLGYMFLAVGVGAFGAALFHLMTHAFFKALMFLGSGSVIHAMHEEQDVRKMGGLKKYLPITHMTFLMGWLAIIGFPLFSGFFSKDEILWMSFHSPLGSPWLWVVGLLGAMMTAFYMTRLMALTFWGSSRVDKKIHPHESPPIMWIPLAILAVLSVGAGWIGIPHVIGAVLPGHPENLLENWLHLSVAKIPGLQEAEASLEWTLMGTSVVLALSSAFAAYHIYCKKPDIAKRFAEKMSGLHRVIYNKYFVDEAYFKFIINPLIENSKRLWYYVDVHIIDKTTYVVSDLARDMGELGKWVQSGNLQQYLMYLVVGIVVIFSFVLMR